MFDDQANLVAEHLAIEVTHLIQVELVDQLAVDFLLQLFKVGFSGFLVGATERGECLGHLGLEPVSAMIVRRMR